MATEEHEQKLEIERSIKVVEKLCKKIESMLSVKIMTQNAKKSKYPNLHEETKIYQFSRYKLEGEDKRDVHLVEELIELCRLSRKIIWDEKHRINEKLKKKPLDTEALREKMCEMFSYIEKIPWDEIYEISITVDLKGDVIYRSGRTSNGNDCKSIYMIGEDEDIKRWVASKIIELCNYALEPDENFKILLDKYETMYGKI